MIPDGPSGSSPRQRIEAACATVGKESVVAACIALLGGSTADPAMVRVLGGPQAMEVVYGALRADQTYWLRVWGARGLLWAWDDVALDALIRAMGDEAWRVREMCCKVIARNEIGDALPHVSVLEDDPVERVRRAAARAVILLTAAGA